MKCHVPVDLLRVEPRIWGDLEMNQVLCLGCAGVVALAALTERLPVAAAVPLAAPFVGYALLELDGQPLRRIAPRIVLGALRARRERSADASLWYEPPGAEALHGGIMHQIRGALHHLAEGR